MRADRTRSPGRGGLQGPQRLLCRSREALPTVVLHRRFSGRDSLEASQRCGRAQPDPAAGNGFHNLSAISSAEVVREPSFSEDRRGCRPCGRPEPRRHPPGTGLRSSGRQYGGSGGLDHRSHVSRRYSRSRHAGRYPGPADRIAEVSPCLWLRRFCRRLGALRRASVQGDGSLSRYRVRLHAARRRIVPGGPACNRHRHSCRRLDRGPGGRLSDKDRPPVAGDRRGPRFGDISRFRTGDSLPDSAC